jgi:hypothetical protein
MSGLIPAPADLKRTRASPKVLGLSQKSNSDSKWAAGEQRAFCQKYAIIKKESCHYHRCE